MFVGAQQTSDQIVPIITHNCKTFASVRKFNLLYHLLVTILIKNFLRKDPWKGTIKETLWFLHTESAPAGAGPRRK